MILVGDVLGVLLALLGARSGVLFLKFKLGKHQFSWWLWIHFSFELHGWITWYFVENLMFLDDRTCAYDMSYTRYCFEQLNCIFTLALLILVAELLVWNMVWVFDENGKLLITLIMILVCFMLGNSWRSVLVILYMIPWL